MLDTIAGGSYGECPYAEISKKLEKISRNNRNEPYVPLQNHEVALRDGGGSMARVEDML